MLKKMIEMKLAGPLNKEIREDYNWTESYLLFTHGTSTKIGAFKRIVERSGVGQNLAREKNRSVSKYEEKSRR